MKKTILFILLISSMSVSQAQVIVFNDPEFKKELIKLGVDTGGDNEISRAEASAYKGPHGNGVIYLTDSGAIKDLTGIEYFTQAKSLRLTDNKIENLDASKNTALTTIIVANNRLKTIKIPSSLQILNIKNNGVKVLNVPNNSKLTYLNTDNNDLTSLNVSSCSSLTKLYCSNNDLTSLNLENGNNRNLELYAHGNPKLKCIQVDNTTNQGVFFKFNRKDLKASYCEDCTNFKPIVLFRGGRGSLVKDKLLKNSAINTNDDNEIQVSEANAYKGKIDVSKNVASYTPTSLEELSGLEAFTNITYLYVDNWGFEGVLDLSVYTALETISCYSNNLTGLIIPANSNLDEINCQYNKLEQLDVSKFPKLTWLQAKNNPKLTCIGISSQQKPGYHWKKDDKTQFSTSCAAAAGIEDIELNDTSFSVYPNPFQNTLHIVSEKEIRDVLIYNLLGQMVLKSTKSTIDVSKFAKGVYVVKVTTTTGSTITKKMIKE